MHDDPDQVAFEKILKVDPAWSGIKQADDALNLPGKILLHAGPPFPHLEEIPVPVLNSAAVACVFEGWTRTLNDATSLLKSGEVKFSSAQDYQVVLPMAAVVSPSMKLIEITDLNNPIRCAWSTINGGGNGGDPVPRYGKKSQAAINFLNFLNNDIAAAFNRLSDNPIPWIPIIDEALCLGDDGHLCHVAAHKLMLKKFKMSSRFSNLRNDIREFLESWPFIHLNFWMACAKLSLSAMSGTSCSTMVTDIAGNGNEFGIKIAGLPSRWFCSNASKPRGKIRHPFKLETTLGALGDSAITEGFGTGAMALSYTPEMQRLHKGHYGKADLNTPHQILFGRHSKFKKSKLKCGLAAKNVVSKNITPIIELGIIDKHGENGGLGAGIFRPDINVFERAVEALNKL